jgi:hypothetical protein
MGPTSWRHVQYLLTGTIHSKITLVPEVYFYYFHCEGERKIQKYIAAIFNYTSETCAPIKLCALRV